MNFPFRHFAAALAGCVAVLWGASALAGAVEAGRSQLREPAAAQRLLLTPAALHQHSGPKPPPEPPPKPWPIPSPRPEPWPWPWPDPDAPWPGPGPTPEPIGPE